jgi:RNA polymerase sigma-70 factor (ECF subfamily)
MTILRNARIDRLRSSGDAAREVSLDAMELEPAEQPSSKALDWEAIRKDPQRVLAEFSDEQVIQALQRLPEEIRWTLLLTDVEAMDQAEAAQVLQVPVGTIKSRVHRGRAMLRQALAPMWRTRGRVEVSDGNQ